MNKWELFWIHRVNRALGLVFQHFRQNVRFLSMSGCILELEVPQSILATSYCWSVWAILNSNTTTLQLHTGYAMPSGYLTLFCHGGARCTSGIWLFCCVLNPYRCPKACYVVHYCPFNCEDGISNSRFLISQSCS